MKNNFKKFLSLLLTFSLVIPMCTFLAISSVAEGTGNVKQVVKISDFGAGFESSSNPYEAYLCEETTFLGKTVRKITRNPDVTDAQAAEANPIFYKYAAILDENSNPIKVKNAQYVTIRYYYASSDANPVLVGNGMTWEQLKIYPAGAGTAYGGGAAHAYVDNTSDGTTGMGTKVKANEWGTITIHLGAQGYFTGGSDTYKPWNTKQPDGTLGQFKFRMLENSYFGSNSNKRTLGMNDVLYIGDIIFTNYDPREEMAADIDTVYVSETGNDANAGTSIASPVKTIGKAFELVNGKEAPYIILDGNVSQGTVTTIGDGVTATIAAFSENGATITGGYTAVCNTVFDNVALDGTLAAGGYDITVNKNSKINGASVTADGARLYLKGGSFGTVTFNESTSATLNVDGATVGAVAFGGKVNVFTLALGAGSIGTVGAGTVDHLQTVTAPLNDNEWVTLPSLAGISAATTTKLYAPKMKASNGLILPILGTNTAGKLETHDGVDLNFGYGLTYYIVFTPSADGNKVYYSNSNTNYTLTVPTGGTYYLDIAGEKDYIASNGAPIYCFSTSKHLTLPEGMTGWSDDNAGTFTAVNNAYITVYVSNKYGNDNNPGTQESPMKTIKAAIEKKIGSNDGKIYIMDTIADAEFYKYGDKSVQNILMYDAPTHTGTITYEGVTEGAILCFGETYLIQNGPSIWKNIAFVEGIYSNGSYFVTNGYDSTFEGNIKYMTVAWNYVPSTTPADLTDSARYASKTNPVQVANEGLNEVADMSVGPALSSSHDRGGKIIFRHSGVRIHTLRMTSDFGDVTLSKPQTIVIDGASIGTIRLKNGTNSSNKTVNLNTSNYIINSGSVGEIAAHFSCWSSGKTTITNLQIIFNNGMTPPSNFAYGCANNFFTAYNAWVLLSADKTGKSLMTTDTAGVYKVIGAEGLVAKAIRRTDGATVYATGDTLDLSSYSVKYLSGDGKSTIMSSGHGVWDVTYVSLSELPYTFDGEILTVNQNNTAINLSSFAPTKEGMIFLGWSHNSTGTQPFTATSVTLNAGEKAYAIFADASVDVIGAQIVTDENTNHPTLRFISTIKKSLIDILGEGVVYGSLVLPADQFTGELTETTFMVKKIPGNGHANGTEFEFTADLLMKGKSEYTRLYTVRPYVTFTDLNGNTTTVYGEAWSTRIYRVASDELNDEDATMTDHHMDVLTEIVKIAAEAINHPGDIMYGDVSGVTSYTSATEEDFKQGKVVYKTSAGRVFEWKDMIDPIWDGDTMYDETAIFFEGEGAVELLYAAKEIVSVRSYDLRTEYKRGIDWDIDADGRLVRLSGSNIPYLPDSLYYLDTNPEWTTEGKVYGTDYYLDYDINGNLRPVPISVAASGGADGQFNSYQVCVTYKYNENDNIDVEEYFSNDTYVDRMSGFIDKLEAGEDVTVIVHGDSITRGRGSSMMRWEEPYKPNYAALMVQALAYEYGYKIEYADLNLRDDNGRWDYTSSSSTGDYPIRSQSFGNNGTITYVNVAHSGWRVHTDHSGSDYYYYDEATGTYQYEPSAEHPNVIGNAAYEKVDGKSGHMGQNANCDCYYCHNITDHLYNPIDTYGCDLLILAFGMNNGWMVGNTYEKNVGSWVADLAIKAKAHIGGSADFCTLMVSPFLECYDHWKYNSDGELVKNASGVEAYEAHFITNAETLTNVSGIPTAVARMSSVHTVVKNTGMRYINWTSNNLNHPNDFLHGLYAQVLLYTVLGYDKVMHLEDEGGYGDETLETPVREIVIEGGNNVNATDIVIGQITDAHINLLDPVLDKYNAEVQFSNQTRTWLKDGASIPALRNALETAKYYDTMVFTGDMIDYLTHGALKALKAEVFDKYPNSLSALGDHDMVRNMVTNIPEQTPLDSRYAILEDYWYHDVYYYSKVVGNNALIVAIDNTQSKYWPSQIDKLQADIDLARREGYAVLIFQHKPIPTLNEAHTAVKALDTNETYNFYKAEIDLNDAVTKQVYEIITKNADVVKGVFAGHAHKHLYAEINATLPDGTPTTIPQYVTRANAFDAVTGNVTKIVVKAGEAASDYTASLTTPTPSVKNSEEAVVTVNVASALKQSFASGQVTLTYDPSCFEFVRVEGSSVYTANNNKRGTVVIGIHGDDHALGEAFNVVFMAKKQSPGSEITLESAFFAEMDSASSEDQPPCIIDPATVAIKITKGSFKVTIPDIFRSETTEVDEGGNFTFSIALDGGNYEYKNVAVNTGTLTDNGDGTYTVTGVQKDLVISGERTAKSFGVTINGDYESGESTATFGSNYTMVLLPDPDGFTYSVTSVTIGGVASNAYSYNTETRTLTIDGNFITGAIEITVTKSVAISGISVNVIGATGVVNGNFPIGVEEGSSYTITLNARVGYSYKVTATMGGQSVAVTNNGNYTYTVENITANVVFTVEEKIDTEEKLEYGEYGNLGQSTTAFSVVFKTEKLEGHVYTVNGNVMLWSDLHDAYVYLFIGSEKPEITLGVVAGEAEVIPEGFNANKTAKLDMNDAQFAYNVYLGIYTDFSEITMEKYFRCDVNADGKIDVTDAQLIANEVINP